MVPFGLAAQYGPRHTAPTWGTLTVTEEAGFDFGRLACTSTEQSRKTPDSTTVTTVEFKVDYPKTSNSSCVVWERR